MSALSPTPSTALQAAAGLIASGRPEAAARELTALVHAAPTYAAAHVLLAKAREASGDRVRALEAWHRAYFLVPSSPLVRRERQRLLDALAPPEAEAIADEAPAVRADEPETAALLPPMAAPEAAPPPPPPETDWDVVDEHDEDGSEAFPAPPSRPVAPDLVPPGDDRVPAPGTPTGPPPTDAVEVPSELDDDLDSLIRDLEDAPRIRPDPEYDGPEERGAEAAVDEVASETLAKIYAAQQQYAEAAVVYEKLARQSPGRAAELQKQAEEMRRRAS